MRAVEYQIVINRPLQEVLDILEAYGVADAQNLTMTAGGYRFEAVVDGTRITLIGDPLFDPVRSRADELVTQVFKSLAAQSARPPINA